MQIGIRREDKNELERRAPLTPTHVEELVKEKGLRVVVQPSKKRIFADEAFAAAGAIVQEDLTGCTAVLGVKEIPPSQVVPNTTYLCFAHVIKGQPESMPVLQKMLDLRCTLIDYEPIVDRFGRRLVFFGRHAGYAGMIDAFWALGRRLQSMGYETPFSSVQQAHAYSGVEEAESFLANTVAPAIREGGIDPALHPLVVGFTGGGNVSQGAQEIFERLPLVEIEPADLAVLHERPQLSRRVIYKVVFRRPDRRQFSRYLPYLTMLVNGIYWEPGNPKIATKGELRDLWRREERPRLQVLADLSCDVDGSIEATVRATTPQDPVYVFEPETGNTPSGVEGRGPVVLAVDNLPAEFPQDASEHFGDCLFPFIPGLAEANFDVNFEHLSLPAAVLGAVITFDGELTPQYRYLETYLGEEKA